MSTTNLARIRKGDIGVSWEAADGIDDALLWERGQGIQAVLAGKSPVEAAPERREVDVATSPDLGYEESPERPLIGTREWLIYYRSKLGETDFREVRNVLLRMLKAEARVIELEQELAERGEPVNSAQVSTG